MEYIWQRSELHISSSLSAHKIIEPRNCFRCLIPLPKVTLQLQNPYPYFLVTVVIPKHLKGAKLEKSAFYFWRLNSYPGNLLVAKSEIFVQSCSLSRFSCSQDLGHLVLCGFNITFHRLVKNLKNEASRVHPPLTVQKGFFTSKINHPFPTKYQMLNWYNCFWQKSKRSH